MVFEQFMFHRLMQRRESRAQDYSSGLGKFQVSGSAVLVDLVVNRVPVLVDDDVPVVVRVARLTDDEVSLRLTRLVVRGASF
ncbi:MAG: hypothetical protein ACRDOL_39235 [Streptosporangiaceae bacterium]